MIVLQNLTCDRSGPVDPRGGTGNGTLKPLLLCQGRCKQPRHWARNVTPLLAERRASKRQQLLEATQQELDKIVQATERPQRALQGKDKIALRVGKVLQRFKVGKHFQLEITEESFNYCRKQEAIERESSVTFFL